MKSRVIFLAIFSFSILFLFQYCQTTTKQVSAIQPPLGKVDVGFQQFNLQTDKTQVLELENGTTIEIKAHTFVDENGTPVHEDVTLEYREFHTAADIIASGIPMSYDTGGASYTFETAGMFEIDANADGAPVFIDEGKDIQVNMASFAEGDDFNFYALDEVTGDWSYTGTARPQPMRTGEAINGDTNDTETIDPNPEPVMPVNSKDVASVIDLDVDYSAFPELKPFKTIVWTYAGKNKQARDQVFNTTWRNISLEQGDGAYIMKLSDLEKSAELEVQPVLNEADYEAAMQDFENRMDEYDSRQQQMAEERQRLETEAQLVRSFQVQNFGTYNWDRIYKRPEMVRVDADFQFNEELDADINNVKVYLVSGLDRAITTYYPSDWQRFSFDPTDNNKLLAVLPGNRIAVFSQKDFDKIDPGPINRDEPLSYTFKMKTVPGEVNQMEDLQSILATI